MRVIACAAPFGQGGLGQHLEQLVAAVRAEGGPVRYACTSPAPDDPDGTAFALPGFRAIARLTPARWHPAWQTRLWGERFDQAVARWLPAGSDVFAFGGQALASFARARALGYERTILVSPLAHADHYLARQREALARHPLERGWFDAHQAERWRREYALADVIEVSSSYVERTFLEAGVPASKLRFRPLRAHPRFRLREAPPPGDPFRAVYVGALSVAKGLPLLLEAFARLDDPRARLTLVGGWGTRGMRRYLARARELDPRVDLAVGDPLPHLQAAHVLVHASHSDALGFAPLEAVACGVPVIVTDRTGMHDQVPAGADATVVPAGDLDALTEALRRVHARTTGRDRAA